MATESKNATQTAGKAGEQQVAHYLQDQGFTILEQNYRKRTGEVDLIAHKKELVVFVEVKLRSKHHFDLSEVITRSKQCKIISAAKDFLFRNTSLLERCTCRFDVALVENGTIKYIPNAFSEG